MEGSNTTFRGGTPSGVAGQSIRRGSARRCGVQRGSMRYGEYEKGEHSEIHLAGKGHLEGSCVWWMGSEAA